MMSIKHMGAILETRGSNYFWPKYYSIMSHEHQNDQHTHREAEENEIGGPVLFAIICAALAVLVIYFLI